MLPTLQVGPLAIQFPGLVILAGLWLGLSLAERFSENRGIPKDDLYNLALISLIFGLAGARIFYAIQHWAAFASSPLSLLSLDPALLDPLAGLATGPLAGLAFLQRKGLPFWSALDALTPAFAVVQIALHLAHLASGAAFGAPSSLPWAIELWGVERHPTQIYAALLAAGILMLLWPGRAAVHRATPGISFLVFLALSALAAIFVEAFRGDSRLLPGGLRTVQVAAWGLLALSLWGVGQLRARLNEQAQPGIEAGQLK